MAVPCGRLLLPEPLDCRNVERGIRSPLIRKAKPVAVISPSETTLAVMCSRKTTLQFLRYRRIASFSCAAMVVSRSLFFRSLFSRQGFFIEPIFEMSVL